MPTPRRISGEEVARNKKKQQILRQAGYNVKVDGNWGEWQDRKYKEVMAKRTRRNNANVGVLALPAAAALGSTVGSTISAGAVGSALASAAMAAPVALTLLGPAFSLADRIKGTVRTMPRTNKPGVETVDATRVSRPIVVTTPASNVEQAMLRQLAKKLARKKAARTKTKTASQAASQAAPTNPQQDQEENKQQQNNQQNNNQQQQNNQQNNNQQQGNGQQEQSNPTQGNNQSATQQDTGWKSKFDRFWNRFKGNNSKSQEVQTKESKRFFSKPTLKKALKWYGGSWAVPTVGDIIGNVAYATTHTEPAPAQFPLLRARSKVEGTIGKGISTGWNYIGNLYNPHRTAVIDTTTVATPPATTQQNKEVQDTAVVEPNQKPKQGPIADYVEILYK